MVDRESSDTHKVFVKRNSILRGKSLERVRSGNRNAERRLTFSAIVSCERRERIYSAEVKSLRTLLRKFGGSLHECISAGLDIARMVRKISLAPHLAFLCSSKQQHDQWHQ